MPGAAEQRRRQRRDERRHDLVLDVEHVGHLTVVLRTTLETGDGVDELRAHAQPRAGAAHAAFDERGGAERRADFLRRVTGVAEPERRRARRDAEPLDPSKRVDQILGDAVAEERAVGLAAHVPERQHRHRRRRHGLGRHGRRREGRARPALRALEIGADVGGALIAETGILLQQLVDDGDELARQRGVDALRRRGLPVQHGRGDDAGRRARKRLPSRRHFVQHRRRARTDPIADRPVPPAPARAPCRPASRWPARPRSAPPSSPPPPRRPSSRRRNPAPSRRRGR